MAVGLLVALTSVGACGAPGQTQTSDTPTAKATAPARAVTSPPATTRPVPAKPAVPKNPPAPAVAPTATGGIVVNASGAVLPDAARTPGALNPAVTQGTISSTICVTGWTSTVRPPSSVTTKIKIGQLASGYAYEGDLATADYEEDHLISLELGGAAAAEANLWPEPYNSPEGARVKDTVENKLHTLVCAGTLSLATAQHAIATDWWTAYLKYVNAAPAPAAPLAPAARAPAQPAAPAPAAVPASGATALCNDGTYSYAAHHQGACSRHGGVKVFYK
jgi:hypothetical protein